MVSLLALVTFRALVKILGLVLPDALSENITKEEPVPLLFRLVDKLSEVLTDLYSLQFSRIFQIDPRILGLFKPFGWTTDLDDIVSVEFVILQITSLPWF